MAMGAAKKKITKRHRAPGAGRPRTAAKKKVGNRLQQLLPEKDTLLDFDFGFTSILFRK